MRDEDKTKQQLIEELEELRRRVAQSESAGTGRAQPQDPPKPGDGTNVDITERKRAEEALRESEGRYRALAESTTDIIFIIDREGGLLYANRAASQCIGIRSGEIVGKRQANLFPPEMAQAHVERIGRVFATGEVLAEDESFQFGPERVWLRVHLLPLRDETGQVASVMGVCHNVTERKQVEEALQKAHHELERRVEERTAELATANKELTIFRTFADTSTQGFSMADLDGHITYLNPALCRILGEERAEDAIGKHLSIHFSEESSRRGKEEIEPVLNREGYWEGELPMLTRQGTSVPTWHHTFVIRDEQGMPFRLGVVITDVTERKRAEEALERERRTLEHLFRSTDHERRLIAYEIHDGLAQLLAGAIMQFDTFAHLKEKKSRGAQKVFDAAMLMLRQSHAEARRLISGVRPPILDEAGIVTAISHLIHEQREPNGPQIEYHADVRFDRLVPIQENAIYRIVQEALANACKYSQTEKIRVQVAQRGDDVWIEVQDWGIGFRQDEIGEQCFGLHGIRERTRLLGGKTTIETEPGRGTRIVVEMPFIVREKDDSQPIVSSDPP